MKLRKHPIIIYGTVNHFAGDLLRTEFDLKTEIVPVDYANTGVSQENMHWSDGLNQFLQLKHHLRMTLERNLSQ